MNSHSSSKDKKYSFGTYTLILIVFTAGFMMSVAIESYEDKRINEVKDYCTDSIQQLQDHCVYNMELISNTSREICDLRVAYTKEVQE